MPSTFNVLQKARVIKASAHRLSLRTQDDKETATLIQDLATALEELTQVVEDLERKRP